MSPIPTIPADVVIPEDVLRSASGCYLSVHLHPGGFQLSVFDPTEGKFLWFKMVAVEILHPGPFSDIASFIAQCSWTRQVFRAITISFDTPDFTLAPTGMVQQGKEAELLAFHAPGKKQDVEVYLLQESAISVVFEVPSAIRQIQRNFAGSRIFPSVALFIRYVMGHNDRSQTEIHTLVEPGYLLLCVMNKGKHQMTNHFSIESDEDILYFVAHAGIRLNIDLESAKITLYGQAISNNLSDLLHQYCQNIVRWNAPAGFHLPPDADACNHFSTIIHPICAS